MNWYDAEREIGYRKAQAVVYGERSRMLAEVEAMQAQQRRVRRMKLMACVAAKWQMLRRLVGGGDDEAAAVGKIARTGGTGG